MEDSVFDESVCYNRPALPNFQLACLELSLEAGLTRLSELKELQYVNITKLAHQIGVRELEWINENWPNLRKLDGLLDDWYPTKEP